MDSKILEVTLISARNLKRVRHLSKMEVFVVIKISGDPNCTEHRSPVNRDGGSNPMWNHTMRFNISQNAAQTNRSFVQFILKCDRTVRGEKDIGVVYVPIKELIDRANHGNSIVNVRRAVKTDSGDVGDLNFSYRFINKENGANTNSSMPETAYPPQPAYAPPPTPPAGYPFVGYVMPQAAAPAGHAYPPAEGSAGYCPPGVVPPQEGKKKTSKLKVGAALVGGIVGGIVLSKIKGAAASQETTDNDGCYNYGDEGDATGYDNGDNDNGACY